MPFPFQANRHTITGTFASRASAAIAPMAFAAAALALALALAACGGPGNPGSAPTVLAPSAQSTLAPQVLAPAAQPSAAPPAATSRAPAVTLVAASNIALPAGFRAYVFASDLTNPTSLAFGPDGRVYVAQADGAIVSFEDQNGAGADIRRATKVAGVVLGIAFRPGTRDLYISSTGTISIAREAPDGSFAVPVQIVGGLPNGRHQNDEIAFTPDGSSFYLGVGSTCDACVEPDPRSASIMRFSADGGTQQVYAHGVRNPFGLAIHPQTGELFATDNGRDAPASGVPDELNVIVANGNCGWPDCWGIGKGTNCAGTVPPIAQFQEHSSPDGFAFYTGASFPAEYRGNAFVALWGANAGTPGIGRRIERVVLTQAGGQWRAAVTTFASGFDHPLAVAVSPRDGALFVADFGSGRIYRIVWQGG